VIASVEVELEAASGLIMLVEHHDKEAHFYAISNVPNACAASVALLCRCL
jgi:hypothetical protein